jgi:hypothetical protein
MEFFDHVLNSCQRHMFLKKVSMILQTCYSGHSQLLMHTFQIKYHILVNKRVKLVLEQAMKAQSGGRGIALLFLQPRR